MDDDLVDQLMKLDDLLEVNLEVNNVDMNHRKIDHLSNTELAPQLTQPSGSSADPWMNGDQLPAHNPNPPLSDLPGLADQDLYQPSKAPETLLTVKQKLDNAQQQISRLQSENQQLKYEQQQQMKRLQNLNRLKLIANRKKQRTIEIQQKSILQLLRINQQQRSNLHKSAKNNQHLQTTNKKLQADLNKARMQKKQNNTKNTTGSTDTSVESIDASTFSKLMAMNRTELKDFYSSIKDQNMQARLKRKVKQAKNRQSAEKSRIKKRKEIERLVTEVEQLKTETSANTQENRRINSYDMSWIKKQTDVKSRIVSSNEDKMDDQLTDG